MAAVAWRRVRRWRLGLMAGAAAMLVLVPAASAADLNATPSTFATAFRNAQGGDVIHLAAGDYGTFKGGAKSSMVTIQADPGVAASIAADLDGSSYIRFKGLTVKSAYMIHSDHIQFVGNTVTGATQIDAGNADMAILLDGNTYDDINVCSTCYEGRVTVVGGSGGVANGVRITNSHFSGGDADGIQITGGATGTQIGPGNIFENIVEIDATHTDPIQLYGSHKTHIFGNFLYGNETGIMAPDGADHEVIENNVILTKRDGTGYPWPIVLGSDNGSVVQHNTLPDGACNWTMRCGTLRVYGGNSGTASRNTVVSDNIVGELDVEGGSTLAADDHNLMANGAAAGTGDVKGKPTFTGGSSPSTWSGFQLATASLGHANASDGTDRGAAISGTSTAPSPTPTPAPSPTPTPSPTPAPSPTPTPSPTPAPSPSPTPAPSPSPTPAPSPSPTPSSTPSPTPTPGGGATGTAVHAVWSPPRNVRVGTAVTLDGTGSTGDGPLICTWSFENQDASTVWEMRSGCRITMTFANADTKYVRLIVTDADGDTDQSLQSFAVAAASPAPTPTATPTPRPSPTATPTSAATPVPPVPAAPVVTPEPLLPLRVPLPSGRSPSTPPSLAPTASANGSGLVAAFGFSDRRGTLATDASGHGRRARIKGAAHTRSGRFGASLRFDGRSDAVTTRRALALDPSGGMTLEAWARPSTGMRGKRPVVVWATRRGGSFGLYTSARGARTAGVARAGGLAAVARYQPRTGQWMHLAVTYAGHTLTLYVDGLLAGRRTVAWRPQGRGPLIIGGSGARGRSFRGGIDEVRLYGRALTKNEIRHDLHTPLR